MRGTIAEPKTTSRRNSPCPKAEANGLEFRSWRHGPEVPSEGLALPTPHGMGVFDASSPPRTPPNIPLSSIPAARSLERERANHRTDRGGKRRFALRRTIRHAP